MKKPIRKFAAPHNDVQRLIDECIETEGRWTEFGFRFPLFQEVIYMMNTLSHKLKAREEEIVQLKARLIQAESVSRRRT